LTRPRNVAAHGQPDAADLAAAYAFGFARNHPFNDGNKRTFWVAARLFLADNGLSFWFDRLKSIAIMEALAAGTLPEENLAIWLRYKIESL
jgi:death-on-curing protein